MGWKEQLQPASFRGVPFHVEGDDNGGGRRGVLHEYPLRDEPLFEDQGRKARDGSLTAFVIGDEYMAARDSLIKALEEKGSGELVHPWLGRKTLSVVDFRYRHSNREGGMCRFDINFVEAGQQNYPAASIATSQQSILSVEVLEQTAIDEFTETFSVDGLPAFGVLDAVTGANDIVATLEGALGSIGGVLSNPIGSISEELGSLVTDPLALANRMFSLFNKASAVLGTGARLIAGYSDLDSLNFARAFTTLRAISLFPESSRGGNLTPTRTRMADNRDALNKLTRAALLTQAAGMTAVMPLPVYDDAIRLRSETLAALDTESLEAEDDTYLALVDLRSKVHTDMTSRIQSAARLRDIRPAEVGPALALSYELYETVDREGEIIARNRLRHPGFVPAETLKVLAS
jgi:prophage DNA circulation protein